jgi:hypothetical protein
MNNEWIKHATFTVKYLYFLYLNARSFHQTIRCGQNNTPSFYTDVSLPRLNAWILDHAGPHISSSGTSACPLYPNRTIGEQKIDGTSSRALNRLRAQTSVQIILAVIISLR